MEIRRPAVQLRDVTEEDLPIFFEQQLDSAANHMVAFTRKEPTNRVAFDAHWKKIRGDENITIRTIACEDRVAGHVACFGSADEREVTYWLGKAFWGKGIATKALSQFLRDAVNSRPIYARVAKDNFASIRVLEKCGFAICGQDRFFANARGEEIEEVILKRTD